VVLDAVICDHRLHLALAGDADERGVLGRNVKIIQGIGVFDIAWVTGVQVIYDDDRVAVKDLARVGRQHTAVIDLHAAGEFAERFGVGLDEAPLPVLGQRIDR
jgi:hypothetical protein